MMYRTTLAGCIVVVGALSGCAAKVASVQQPDLPYDGPIVRLHYAPGPSDTILVGTAAALDYVNARRHEVGTYCGG
jgi:hypothetical protein